VYNSPQHTSDIVVVITKNNFHTLMDLVIANLTHTNMVQRTSTMTTHATTMVAQEKTQSYAK
jgi:hypothetical protein